MAVPTLVTPAGSRLSAESGSEAGLMDDAVTGVVSKEPDFEFKCIPGQSLAW